MAHFLSIEETFRKYESDPEGLSSETVHQRLQEFGKNQLEEKNISKVTLFFRQFHNPLVYILFAASFISISVAKITDFFAIIGIILINGLIGFYQELKAAKTIQGLKEMTESQSRVIRNGELVEIPSSELVPGDYQLFQEGELISADVRLTKAESLTINEASITGESTPVIKDAEEVLEQDTPAFELKNMLLTGTSIMRGSGEGIVVQTGANTYLASIAEKAQEDSPETPLTKAIRYFSNRYILLMIGLFAFMGLVGYMQGRSLLDLAYILLAGIVSAVPEGLPLVVTLVMVIGTIALSKHKALVRSLSSVETLGSVTVLASDKTGTITKGTLTVEQVFSSDEKKLKKIAALCNDARGKSGDPLDVALAHWVDAFQEIREKHPRIWTHPFDSKLMLMATATDEELYVKGAFEALKEKATSQDLQEIERTYHKFLEQGLRTLAFGCGEKTENRDPNSWEITITGLIGFIDPAKEGVKEAVGFAQKAGIHTIMITGDHPKTAQAIAESVGIDAKSCVTGQEVASLSDEELTEAIEKSSVLARILPEHKYRVVQALQAADELVAVTGDGVNDVPALKAADIGIAMGSGSAAAKDASDMVITDNNLKIIVDAIRNARVIADNIRKVIYYLCATSLMEVILIALSIFSNLPLPLTALQILWINIVTDGVQDKMFAFAKEEGNVMERGPRPPKRQFFAPMQIFRIAYFSIVLGGMTFLLYLYLLDQGHPLITIHTMVFTTVVFMQWANGLQAQKEKEPYLKNIWSSLTINPLIFVGLGGSFLLQGIPLYLLPEIFHCTPLSFHEMLYPIGGFCLSFFAVELRKWGEIALFQMTSIRKFFIKTD